MGTPLKSVGNALGHGLGYAVSRFRSNRDELRTEEAERLLDCLVEAGPIYMKMGQLLATRSDLVPSEWADKLRTLQDDAPHMDAATTRAVVTRELRAPMNSVFREFDLQPVASGSVAQVHRARLLSGQQVAVKLVKEGVPEHIEQNLRMMRRGVRLAEKVVPAVAASDGLRRFTEVATLFRSQADMLQEAVRQKAVYRNFEGHPYVRVPRVIPDLVTPRMLTMEFMEGIRGNAAQQVKLPAHQLARRLQDTIYTMLYMHGLSHGDPHPGNILFSEEGELILLDYGITVELTEDEKWGLSSFYYACTRKEWDVAVERFTAHFVTGGEHLRDNWAEYRSELVAALEHHFDTASNRWSTISYFRDVSDILRKYGARYTTSFTKVELVFLSCEGFATQLDPEINIWENARKFTDRYSPYMSKAVRARFDEQFTTQIPGSLELRDRAGRSLVAPTHIHRYFFPSTYPIFVKEARAGRVRDVDGNEYVDLSGGYGPHILGYSHPVVNEAITAGVEAGLVNGIGHEPEVELAEALVDAFPAADRALLCNSGTEAVLLAIRLCRAARKRKIVAKFEGHYHGFSDQGMVSSWFRFTGDKHSPKPIAGSLGTDSDVIESTVVLQYGDIGGLERLRAHADELACVIVEPMPSSTTTFDLEFLTALRKVCTDTGVPLVFDEVVTGFRVAYGGAQTMAGIEPDLTCLGKIIGGGLPCGAVVGRSELVETCRSSEDPFLDYERKAFAGGTLSGNSLTCRAGLAVLTHLRANQQLYEELEAKTQWLRNEFAESTAKRGISCRINARNSIFSLNFSHRSAGIYRERMAGSNFKATIALAYYMRQHGVYMPELHSFLLSTAHTVEDLAATGKAFDLSVAEMANDGFFTT
ncbi:aminotransferase class III-fold pyridoxal phosphate-dependent enzyme [Streptomyces sp. NBC_00525]|uniref:aminotransferase class III-fold pyridoxal phosphate-dependent enzyme n=1 Tax=Streptomyces sp. NBC_00525 TaxID=2903660 RepID=UPI002E8105D2|nr:aminotransferase class III-fold pyridoxal phosphate-dependent enzyme [Streptomyces sp. NBC_00525]WUC97135.1 aminotransferase class III-fold pyridoxal phosphate-dependent enzyme [Streptomyces sp. NBC_00525]